MKRSLIYNIGFVAVLALALSCSGKKVNSENIETVSGSDSATIVFSEYEHDFGKIEEGEKVAYVFTYQNTGNAPLVINYASTSCGCTASKYSTKPLAPGEKGTIEVQFDSSGRGGKQSKIVTIKSNATKPMVLLRITGEVINSNNNN